MSEIPPDLHYTAEHEWVRRMGPDTVRVGITDYAQSELGDVVLVDLPEIGAEFSAGDEFGEIHSPKASNELYSPVSAKVVAVNDDLANTPGAVNAEPYGGGWLIELQADAGALDGEIAALLDAEGYQDKTAE